MTCLSVKLYLPTCQEYLDADMMKVIDISISILLSIIFCRANNLKAYIMVSNID